MTKAATTSRIAAVQEIPMTVLVCGHQVTKRFELDGDGKLIKSTAVPVGKARVEQWSVSSAVGMAKAILEVMTPNEVFMLGHFPDNTEYVVPKGVSLGAGHVHRTKECASWSVGPQWMVLDVDKSHCRVPFQTPEALHERLIEIAPCLDGVEMLIVSSGSSGIYRAVDGAELSGYGGWHVWLRLARGTDWEDFVDWLVARCWLSGDFRHVVSGSGCLIERGIVDGVVKSPERIMYSGPSTMGAGLAQQRKFEVFGDEGRELSNWKRLTADEKKEVAKRKELSRHSVMGQAEETKEKWLLARAAKLEAKGLSRVDATSRALAALDGHLDDEWELILESGKAITVGELLKDRASYDGVRCLDPLEPEYQDHACVGRVFWRENGKKPILHSFAHGGANYTLGGKVDTLSALISDLVYVVEERMFFSLSNPSVSYSRDSLNFTYGHELENTYKQMLEHTDKQVVQSRMWWPGKERIFDHEAAKCFNTAEDLTAKPGMVADEDVAPWLEHMHFIYGNVADWVLDHMAFMVQNPGVKQNVHVICGGEHGVGKDLTMNPLRHWYASKKCLGSVAALKEILDYHDQLINARMVVVSECEITELALADRNRMMTMLKAFTVSNGPGELLSLNAKRKDRVRQVNLMSWFMFTNSPRPLELEHGDRRFMFHWCSQQPKPLDYYIRLANWCNENWQTVVAWLAARVISEDYSPNGNAPATAEKANLIEERQWDDYAIIGDMLGAFEGTPAVSIHMLYAVACELGMEFKSKAGGIKALSLKARNWALRTQHAMENLKGKPSGKGGADVRRTAIILDHASWSALGTPAEQLRWLLGREPNGGKF